MAKRVIKLKIATREYSFNIEGEKEEAYRLAARKINTNIAALSKEHNVANWTDQDYLGMTALNLALDNMSMKRSREVGDEDLIQLKKLENEIDKYLNRLETEIK